MGEVHAHAIRASGARLACVADSSDRPSTALAHRLGAERAVSATDVITADDVDVVHICTPNSTHAELTRKVIAAGKSVVCEKPLAVTVEDAHAVVEAAKEAGVVAAVPFVYRYYASVHEARHRIAEGEAGRLWLLHGSYLQDWLSRSEDDNWRVDPALGGRSRSFADIGVHWCDLMEFTTGHRIVRVLARLARAHERRGGAAGGREVGTEDGALVMFETDRGATGQLVASQVSPGRKNRLWFSFDGTEAAYVFDQEQPDSLWIGGAVSSTVVPRGPDTLTTPTGIQLSRLPAGHPQGYQDCFNAFVSDVYASISGQERTTMPTFTDGLRAAVLTRAVLDSAAKESWIEVGS